VKFDTHTRVLLEPAGLWPGLGGPSIQLAAVQEGGTKRHARREIANVNMFGSTQEQRKCEHVHVHVTCTCVYMYMYMM